MGTKLALLRRLWRRLEGDRRAVFADRLRLAGLLEAVQAEDDVPPADLADAQGSEVRFDIHEFEERAAIMEFDGEMPAAEAEALARKIAMRNGTGR